MKVKYNTNAVPIVAKTVIETCDPDKSLFYIYKEEGLVDYTVTVNKDIKIDSEIYSIKEYDKSYVLNTNTTNIIGSDVIVNGTVYFYKIYVLGEYLISDVNDLLLTSNLDIIQSKGVYYTNTVLTNYEITDNVFVYSKPVYDKKAFNYIVNSSNILLTFNKEQDNDYYFKPKYQLCCQPNFVSNSKFHLDTFLIYEGRDKKIALEGDIRLIEKTEYKNDIGNSVSYKDLVWSCEGLYSEESNKSYTSVFDYVGKKTNKTKYICKRSNMIFSIENELHLKVIDGGLKEVEVKDSDITISRVINYDKVNIVLNNHLTEYDSTLNVNGYIISNKEIPLNSKIGLKKAINTNLTQFPSEVYYIQQGDTIIKQHSNNIESLSTIPIIDLGINDEYLKTTDSSLYKSTVFTKLEDKYYYRGDI